MDPQSQNSIANNNNDTTLKRLIVGAIALLLIGFVTYFYVFPQFQGKSKNADGEILWTQELVDARDLIRSGEFEQGRKIIEEGLSSINDDEVKGLYELWLALSYNKNQYQQYAEKLLNVATNKNYNPRTRSYAFALLGELFSRNPPQSVLDTIVNNDSLVKLKVTTSEGATKYRASIINILKNNSELYSNPLLLSRMASLIMMGIHRKELPSNEDTIKEALSYIDQSKNFESEFQKKDIAPSYPEYVFLEVQTLGLIATIENGKYNDLAPKDLDSRFENALTIASVSSGNIEAAVRFNYAWYLSLLIQNKQLGSISSNDAVNTINGLVGKFTTDEKLRDTVMFRFISSAKTRGDNDAIKAINLITSHSTSFKKLMTELSVL